MRYSKRHNLWTRAWTRMDAHIRAWTLKFSENIPKQLKNLIASLMSDWIWLSQTKSDTYPYRIQAITGIAANDHLIPVRPWFVTVVTFVTAFVTVVTESAKSAFFSLGNRLCSILSSGMARTLNNEKSPAATRPNRAKIESKVMVSSDHQKDNDRINLLSSVEDDAADRHIFVS